MIKRAQKLLPSLRISCVTNTIRLANSRDEAKDLFANFIKFNPNIEDSHDEMFQINKRTKFSDADGNRFMQISTCLSVTLRV